MLAFRYLKLPTVWGKTCHFIYTCMVCSLLQDFYLHSITNCFEKFGLRSVCLSLQRS